MSHSIEELLSRGTSLLAAKGITAPALDAALLLAEITGLTRETLYTHANLELSGEQSDRYFELLERRQSGECLAYITGRKEFWGLDFAVTPAVLVPRPDTEILVEAALALLRPADAVLDLCTGSGAVAIALKHEGNAANNLPELDVWASDISENALAVARSSAERLGCAITFVQGDLFDALKNTADLKNTAKKKFDVITANAPYIPSGGINSLAAEVQREPRLALDGGSDGLSVISRIVEGAPLYLETGGTLLLEADPSQMGTIALQMKERGFRHIKMYRDYSGQERVIAGIRAHW
jgi:release factor glutamine methyltransferase